MNEPSTLPISGGRPIIIDIAVKNCGGGSSVAKVAELLISS
jgi:hypothetical protein